MKQRRLRQSDYRQCIALLVAHQHLGLHAIIVEGLHQTVGSHSRPTRPLAGIDNQNPHQFLASLAFRLASFSASLALRLASLA